MGIWNRAIRIAIGLALLGSPLAWYGVENLSSWGFLGIFPLISGITGICPVTAWLRQARAG